MLNIKKLLILLLLILIVTSGCIPPGPEPQPPKKGLLTVYFLNVGQGDSILVRTPEGKNMLIDGANNPDGENIVSYLENIGVKNLNVIIGTHPDGDHIGGLDKIIDAFDTEKIYMPKVQKNTKTFRDVLKSIKNKNLKITRPVAGDDINLDSSLEVKILAPNSSKYENTNNYSIVVKITYKNTSFLFEGDAEEESEKEMLEKGYDLKANVLKLGHHGSHSSTTPEFLEAVSPEYGIISVGNGNKYGHPHKVTLKKLQKNNVKIYRTDKDGTIIATSNGKKIDFTFEKGEPL